MGGKYLLQTLLGVAAAAMVVLATGCATSPSQPPASPADLAFVIPAGTAAAAMRGEAAFALPAEIHLAPGQAIAIRNDDQAMHYFFSEPIAPGQTYRRVFAQSGRYGHTSALSCSLATLSSVRVVVGDGEAGWDNPPA
jgi:hypothetical protein